MVAALLLLTLQQENPMARLEKLGTERRAFNAKVVDDERYESYELRMYTMALDQHIMGYWPIGVSERRYLFYTSGGRIYGIYYQRVTNGKARTLWYLDIEPSEEPPKFKGTFALLLARKGYAPTGKITAAQRATLSAVKAFAVYEYHGLAGEHLDAWVLYPDGTYGQTRHFDGYDTTTDGRTYSSHTPDFIPVLAEEAKLLELGDKSWPKEGRSHGG